MTNKFKVGDHVRWNSEAGHVSGKIVKVHTKDTDYKGYGVTQDRLSDVEVSAFGEA
jgi:hypothetical protein